MQPKDLDRDYEHHPPRSDAEGRRHEHLRGSFKALAGMLEATVPASRELSLAHTHLETALMWANAAVARERYDTQASGE